MYERIGDGERDPLTHRIIGCAIAYELSRRGVTSTVLDSRRLGMAATNAAAGVLSPLAEFQRPGLLVKTGLESLRRYPVWVDRLREDVPDIDVEFAINGVLRVAFSDGELEEYRAGLRYREVVRTERIAQPRDEVERQERRVAGHRDGERMRGGGEPRVQSRQRPGEAADRIRAKARRGASSSTGPSSSG